MAKSENKAKKAKKAKFVAEYAFIRVLAFMLACLPISVSAWLCRRLTGIWRRVDRKHRERAISQSMLRLGVDRPTADRLTRANYAHYGNLIAEFGLLTRVDKKGIADRIDFDGFDRLVASLLAEGRGIVFITGHLGNWEWANSILTALGFHGCAIARPLDNPYLDDFVRSIREKNGCRILDKQGAIRGALKCLRSNGGLAVLIDQDAGYGGLMSPFLGEEASTFSIPIELAIKNRSPIVVAAMVRAGRPGRFRMSYGREALRPRDGREVWEETKRLLDAANAVLGELILQTPEQWFWVHRRWKTREARRIDHGETTGKTQERG